MSSSIAEKQLRSHLPDNFTDDFLFYRALTHRSYVNENKDAIEDNERLEFLGDSILSFVVAEWLYNKFPEKDEGFLTKVRAALVHTEKLSTFARRIKIGPALLLGKGEDLAGGRDRDAILCDAFEAMVAALYLSTDIETVREFMYPLLETESVSILRTHSEEDVKSRLQEWAQSKGYKSPVYAVVSEQGPDHAKVFEVCAVINDQQVACGIGSSKRAAEKVAAFNSMQTLGIL